MGYQIWCIVFVLLSVLSSSFVCGNVFKDFGSNGIPMSSPINVNDQKMEYLDALPSESFTDWPQVQPVRTGRGDDLVCVVPADTKHVSVDEHSHMPMKSMLKYGAMGLLALLLPFLILKLFILPIKFLLGLKMMSLFNSLLLGTLLYSHHHHKPHEDSSYVSSFPVASESQPLTGISGFGGGDGFGTNKKANEAHGVEEVDEIDANSANSDYVDVLQPGDNIDRIFNLAKRQVRKRKLVRKRI